MDREPEKQGEEVKDQKTEPKTSPKNLNTDSIETKMASTPVSQATERAQTFSPRDDSDNELINEEGQTVMISPQLMHVAKRKPGNNNNVNESEEDEDAGNDLSRVKGQGLLPLKTNMANENNNTSKLDMTKAQDTVESLPETVLT